MQAEARQPKKHRHQSIAPNKESLPQGLRANNNQKGLKSLEETTPALAALEKNTNTAMVNEINYR